MTSTAKRVLIVEDDPAIARLLRDNLQFEGFSVEWSRTGRDALALSNRFAPDLVLLDITMPGMNGLETLKRIKAIAPDLPVAMVTAVFMEEEAKRCFEAGAYEYISKPVDFEHLKTALLMTLS